MFPSFLKLRIVLQPVQFSALLDITLKGVQYIHFMEYVDFPLGGTYWLVGRDLQI